MSRYWSPLVHDLQPYVPGEQPRGRDVIKLNTNESPYGPSPRVIAALRAEAGDGLRRYPDPESAALKTSVARAEGLEPAQVFAGNGSDEVLAHAFQALLKHERPLLFPDITYGFYPVFCRLYGIACEQVPLDAAFRVRIEDYLRPNGGIVIANPNAPTGIALPLAELERLLAGNPDSVVLVDEAYVDFGAESACRLIARHPNLLVVQTLSKSRALAGLRVGLALGDAALIEALERVKNSFNAYPLDRLAIAAATAAYEDPDYYTDLCRRVAASRERLAAALAGLGFELLPSSANFLLARHREHDGARLAAALREHGILVRHFEAPRIAQFLRISVGTDAECDALTGALEVILGR